MADRLYFAPALVAGAIGRFGTTGPSRFVGYVSTNVLLSYNRPFFMYEPDLGRVPEIRQRVGIEHEQVRHLADFKRAYVILKTDRPRATRGGGVERFPRRHTTARDQPQLPVVAEPLQLSVTADTQATTSAQDLGGFGRQLRKHVLLVEEPTTGRTAAGHRGHATTRLECQLFVRSGALQLGIGVGILLLASALRHQRFPCGSGKSLVAADPFLMLASASPRR